MWLSEDVEGGAGTSVLAGTMCNADHSGFSYLTGLHGSGFGLLMLDLLLDWSPSILEQTLL